MAQSGNTVVVVQNIQMSPYPMYMKCTRCGVEVVTLAEPTVGLLTWCVSAGLCVVGCNLGCCLFPFFIYECQDIEHRCPQCRTHLGTYRRCCQ
ncbi:unnamed protein product [Medioppia subpectinata]|uniref:LITAF domain-containing protein n=1 Tax=Medioppia subpectinata TaxID=1979941 RepID=A0A7R9KN29_9ACAR|nr:unnamed protein product [Medioppia subpectinata]CAG2106550.1 unnamed protein product [Medioppia subpectinata]